MITRLVVPQLCQKMVIYAEAPKPEGIAQIARTTKLMRALGVEWNPRYDSSNA
jgi:hypothetical protein